MVPEVPEELRQPVAVPSREVRPLDKGGLDDIGLLLVDFDEALGAANSNIVAIDAILIDAKEKADASRVR